MCWKIKNNIETLREFSNKVNLINWAFNNDEHYKAGVLIALSEIKRILKNMGLDLD